VAAEGFGENILDALNCLKLEFQHLFRSRNVSLGTKLVFGFSLPTAAGLILHCHSVLKQIKKTFFNQLILEFVSSFPKSAYEIERVYWKMISLHSIT